MDDQRIVVGAPYQEVFKVFNRKGLTHKKVHLLFYIPIKIISPT